MMALSGVRSSWLMVARKRVFDGIGLLGGGARELERLLLDLAVGDVAHHGDDLGFGFGRDRTSAACSSGRQRISTQMKST